MGTYVITAVEDGLEVPGPIYDNTIVQMELLPTGWVGMRFTGLPYDTFASVGRTQASSVLKTLELQLRVNPQGASLGTLTVGFVDEVDPAAFSGANLPSSKVTTTVGEYTITNAVSQSIAVQFAGEGLATLARRHRQIGWQGKLAFVLTYSGTQLNIASGDNDPADYPTLETEELFYVTGVVGYHEAHSRVDRCPRCGRLQPRELFVKDGFVPSLLVCQRCYDEPDLVHKTGIRPGRERPGIND